MHQATPTQLFIIEDHPVSRLGMCHFLESQGFCICGSRDKAIDLPSIINEAKVHVVVAGIPVLPNNRLSLFIQLSQECPQASILAYSVIDDPGYLRKIFGAGVKGLVFKDDSLDSLAEAIRALSSGKKFLSKSLPTELAQELMAIGLEAGSERFTDRERQVYGLLGKGLGIKEIAAALQLSPKTINTYCDQLKDKLGLKTNRELYHRAVEDVKEGSAKK